MKEEELGDNKATTEPSHRMGPDLLAPALRLLLSMASHWKTIGVLLDIPLGVLDSIEFDNPGSSSACLREMLVPWVKRAKPPPTWEELMEAIEMIDPYLAYKGRTHFNTLCT